MTGDPELCYYNNSAFRYTGQQSNFRRRRNMNLLATASGGAMGWGVILIYVAVIGAFMYFAAIRPQKKEQKRVNAMLANMEVGDVVVTTSGFYGVLIDITEDDVIVEFGSNRNCRIPMKKAAIAEVEKNNE